jgi:hypothetical protein
MLSSVDGRTVASLPLSTQPDGTLAPSMITPGRFLILPQAGPGYYPVSVQLNGQEVIGKPVDLFPGSTSVFQAKRPTAASMADNCNGPCSDSKDIQHLRSHAF